MTEHESFWPHGARLAVTVSMQFEAGGQPISGAGGPITEPILPDFLDLGQNSFYEYGAREGVPRILDLLDKHDVKMSSFMIGDAVRRHPKVAAEIVRRGREAGAHGRSWQRQYHLPRPQEAEWIADSVRAIEQATGTRPTGYNNYWIRPGVNTLEILLARTEHPGRRVRRRSPVHPDHRAAGRAGVPATPARDHRRADRATRGSEPRFRRERPVIRSTAPHRSS
jgi:hypothetical protein